MLLHLGDVGTVEVIDALAVAPPDGSGGARGQLASHVVFGNTDWDCATLARYAQGLGIRVDHPVGRLPLEHGELVFLHGDEPDAMEDALREGVRYLCHGHTHRALDVRKGATRIVNPGALFRAKVYSVAVIDTQSDHVVFYPVGSSEGSNE